MTTDAEDRSTWPRNGQVIRRAELLRLIEENGGPKGLDLRGAIMVGDAPRDDAFWNPIDLNPEALVPPAEAHRQTNGGRNPSWITHWGGIGLDDAQLRQASLHGANLRQAFLGGTHLQGANLAQAHMHGAILYGAELQRARLAWADLRAAEFEDANLQAADLTHTQLQATDLALCQLKAADLRHAQLQGADMYEVRSLDGAHWYGANLDHTRIKRESLGKTIGDETRAHDKNSAEAYREASEAYLLLKNNFNQIGRYEDASWAYMKEQQMEKMAYHWEWRSQGWKVWRAWGSLWRWLRNWAYELATGYGERPWNPVVGGVLIILGFAGGFCATRAIANLWDALIYSLATFATFNLADTGPTGRGADMASSVEALLGIAVLALVIFTLGNKMSRG
jgi:uncharacterized protein YjbI with pentapeptide repeats